MPGRAHTMTSPRSLTVLTTSGTLFPGGTFAAIRRSIGGSATMETSDMAPVPCHHGRTVPVRSPTALHGPSSITRRIISVTAASHPRTAHLALTSASVGGLVRSMTSE